MSKRIPFGRIGQAAALAACMGALCLSGCGRAAPRPNIIFMLVDTLRAESMSCYGYERATSPNLDAFARDAVLFERARSQASCTYPSVNSILSSRYTFDFVGMTNRVVDFPEGMPTLPMILKDHGYATVAVTASPVVRKTPTRHNPVGGFGGGYDVFVEGVIWQNAQIVNDATLAAMTNAARPYFLYIHYMDPHGPYQAPQEYRQFAGPYEGKDFIRKGIPEPIEKMIYRKGPKLDVTAEDLAHLQDLYDDEIYYFDFQFGTMMAELEQRGLLDNTIVVVASDHGEEFMEHGHIKHCRGLYDTLTWVPLIISIPGGPNGRRKALAQNLDIMPTLLEYAGVKLEDYSLKGKTLRPVIESDQPINGHVYSSQGPWRSVDDGRHKLIFNTRNGETELFDLQADPGERANLAGVREDLAGHLTHLITTWEDSERGKLTPEERDRLSGETERKLRSLGYLH